MNTANPPAKSLAQTIAKQIAQEPWEILKQAGRQVTGAEQLAKQEGLGQQSVSTDSSDENQKLISERDKVRSQRLMQALQAELSDIRKKKVQEKALGAQQEQVANEEEKKAKPRLVEPATKKGRQLFNFGKKTQMQRQQTQTERPLPPSG